jgi:hypothetical protein
LLDRYEETDNKKALELLKKISPVAWQHIHFQGHLIFSDQERINLDEITQLLHLGLAGANEQKFTVITTNVL